MTARPFIALAAALLFAIPATAQPAPAPAPGKAGAGDPVVARVNGDEIHRTEVEGFMQTLPAKYQQMPMEQLYPRVLEQLIDTKLIEQAGRKAKLADDPEVKHKLQEIQGQIIGETYVSRYVKDSVTDAKVKERYEAFAKDFKPEEQIQARHILVKTEDEAKAIIAQLKGGADFAALAKDKSTDPGSKASGGDLGWFTKEEMVPEFSEAAFKLQKGQYTDTPVKSQFGYHVIQLEDRRTQPMPTFDEAKDQIKQVLQRELVDQKIKELAQGAKIETFNPDGSKPEPAPVNAGPRVAPGPGPAAAPAEAPPALAPPSANK